MSRISVLRPAVNLRKLATVGLLAAALVTGARSLALFGDVVVDAGNIQTAGSVNLTDSAPVTATLSAGNLAPGDVTTGSITLNNVGTLALRYVLTSSTAAPGADDQALLANSTLTIKTRGVDATCGTVDDGAVYSGTLALAAFGDITAGQNTGDRTLVANTGSETLCFASTFSANAGDAAQTGSIDTTFTFTAEQTANN